MCENHILVSVKIKSKKKTNDSLKKKIDMLSQTP